MSARGPRRSGPSVRRAPAIYGLVCVVGAKREDGIPTSKRVEPRVCDPQAASSGDAGLDLASIEARLLASLTVSTHAMLDHALPKSVAGACAQELAPVVMHINGVKTPHAELSAWAVRMEATATQRHEASQKELGEIKAMVSNTKPMPATQEASAYGRAGWATNHAGTSPPRACSTRRFCKPR